MSSPNMARRCHGACQGSLWRHDQNRSSSVRVYEYCILVGVRLSTFESLQAFERGAFPVVVFTIVGASAWRAKKDATASSFRFVTNQGTHVYCTAPTSSCQDVWLGALHAGLERRLVEPDRPLLKPMRPSNNFRIRDVDKYCRSCGKLERLEFQLVDAVTPLSQYGLEERVTLCPKCLVSQGLLDHIQHVRELWASITHERHAMLKARQICWRALHCHRKNDEDDDDDDDNGEGDNHNNDNDNNINNKNDKVGGDDVASTVNNGDNGSQEISLSHSSTSEMVSNGKKSSQSTPKKSPKKPKSYRPNLPPIQTWVHSPGAADATKAFMSALYSKEFVKQQRISPTLDALCLQVQQGLMSMHDFLENLDAAVGRDGDVPGTDEKDFRVAGDMGTAMKLLLELALPKSETTISFTNDTEMFRCILEFLLNLCSNNDGVSELETLSFFWPQLCHLHLRMLPPSNGAELIRVELMEDFLLTVATKFSVHLALELIWCHTADLEDSLTLSSTTTCAPHCRRRRFAVLRFLCELESLLFDFASGWGGGSVTVGQWITPSVHQVNLLRQVMADLQNFRLAAPDQLSKSFRRDRLTNSRRQGDVAFPEALAQEALRITKNADYLSSHLAFTRRLCDIAERLRFMDLPNRVPTLEMELAKLNASGTMGGDPLNKVNKYMSRVVRIPIAEGHVFRSKERTPVLLLLELVSEEGAEKEQEEQLKQFEQEQQQQKTQQQEGKVEDVGEQQQEEVTEQEEENKDITDNTDQPISSEAIMTTTTTVLEAGDIIKGPQPDQDETDKDIDDSNNNETIQKCEDPVTNNADDGNPQDITMKGENVEKDNALKVTDTDFQDAPQDYDDSEDFHSAHGSDNDSVNGGIEETTNKNDVSSDPTAKTNVQVDAGATPKKSRQKNNTAQRTNKSATSKPSNELEGSRDESDRSKPFALRRFESPVRNEVAPPQTPSKKVVAELVTNVVAKQLHLPNLGAPSSDSNTVSTEEDKSQNSTSAECNKEQRKSSLKMSTLGISGGIEGGETSAPMSKSGDTRREVLNTIMRISGSNTIVADATPAFQRHLQDLARRRAVELLLTGDDSTPPPPEDTARSSELRQESGASREELLSLGIRSISTDNLDGEGAGPSEEDEAMEAVRLLLIQYRVAQGTLSVGAAAQVLAPPHSSLNLINALSSSSTPSKFDPRELPKIDAGDVDPRLVGCGILPPAVLQALTLWKGGMVSNGELLELVKKDLEYVRVSFSLEESRDKLSEDSAFWGRFAFGERWAEKRSRIAATSPEAAQPGWDLIGVIIKSNDDLRQEAFVMQLIELSREAFVDAGLELWLHPYRILSTGRTTGIIEMVRNAMSFDALKKRRGYGKGGLREHLQRMTQFAADPGEAFKTAQQNFVRSLAAYSLLSYLFLFKDRHNGNILLDTAGHVIHIDFGFVFGIAPGGSFSLEMSTPFKLTEEMIEVMDGPRSSLFSEFVTLFCCGFLALQAHCDTFLTLVEIVAEGSTFKCFDGRDCNDVVAKLRERFVPDLGREETIAHALNVIKESTQSYGTKQYDYFQYLSQGIAT